MFNPEREKAGRIANEWESFFLYPSFKRNKGQGEVSGRGERGKQG